MCETIGMQPEPKKPRFLYEKEEQEQRHSDLLVRSLLNFSDNFNLDPSFRLHKHSFDSMTSNLKLAPIHTVSEGLSTYPPSQEYRDSTTTPLSTIKRQESLHISKQEKSLESDLHTSASLALADLPYSHSLQVVTQPVNYQIANYNIHPPPALAVDRAITSNITIHAQLVENDKRTIVDGGFQSGDVRVLRAGHTTLYFTGLKLNKMGPIKTELHFRDYKRIPTNFCIQFKIGNRTIFSEPFKLVSSCAQLPREVRDIVRPSKKTSRSNSPEPDDNLSSSPQALPKESFSNTNMNETILRRELEIAIEAADGEGAAVAAKKLALLRQFH